MGARDLAWSSSFSRAEPRLDAPPAVDGGRSGGHVDDGAVAEWKPDLFTCPTLPERFVLMAPTPTLRQTGRDVQTSDRAGPPAPVDLAPNPGDRPAPGTSSTPPSHVSDPGPSSGAWIRTPDDRLRVFVSSTLDELAEERQAVRAAVETLHLSPVMFEMGARPHPPRELYRAYLDASDVFIGLYAERYGWIGPGADISGIEDEYVRSGGKPRLLYLRRHDEREGRLDALVERIIAEGAACFSLFDGPTDLRARVEEDLAVLLSESFAARHRLGATHDSQMRRSIPAAMDEFVGRQAELVDLEVLLGRSRLVTLTGPGGVGKTRLSLELLHRLDPRPHGGTCFVDLAAIEDPNLVPDAVAQTLGLAATTNLDGVRADVIATALGGRELLLVLDNCEQVIDAVAQLVGHLLARCPALRILATSREPLWIRGEASYAVSPLPVVIDAPDGTVSDGAAVELFARRASQVDPTFVVDDTNRAPIRRLLEELDGLPLAIELSAGRLRTFSPTQIEERLDDRFDLLTSGPRDAPPRHRALSATIEWSYRLLSDDEQVLFRALSVFRGGFELDAVESVAGVGRGTVDLLDVLVAKSLVVVDRTPPSSRYRLLATLRGFAEERLGPDERERLRRGHLDWFADLSAKVDEGLRGPDALAGLRRLVHEAHNARVALGYAISAGHHQEALRITGCLAWFWFRRGEVAEARRWLRQALDNAPTTGTAPYGHALLGLGGIEYLAGDLTEASRCCELAGRIADDVGDARTAARSRVYTAYFQAGLGDLAEAGRLASAARHLAITTAQADIESETYTALGQIARLRGDGREAERLFLAGAAVAERIGHRWQQASALWSASKVALDEGEGDVAHLRLCQAIALNVAEDDLTSTLTGLHTAAGTLALLNRPVDGARLLGAVVALGEQIGYSPEKMDPVDAQKSRARVEQRLSPEASRTSIEEGRRMTLAQALEILGCARLSSAVRATCPPRSPR
jgi:predicted ATPase